MLRYLAKRALTYAFMIFLTTTAGYFLAVNTLQPALLEQERIPRPTPEQVANSFRLKGLDPELSPWERYVDWLTAIVTRWDWGRSPNGAFINAEFGDRVWISTRLFLASIILTLIIGIALGVYTAARQYKASDRVITSYSYLVYIVPAPIAYFLVQLGAININETVGERIFFVTGTGSNSAGRVGAAKRGFTIVRRSDAGSASSSDRITSSYDTPFHDVGSGRGGMHA